MKYLDLSESYEAKSAALDVALNVMLAERLPDSGAIASVTATFDDHLLATVIDPVSGEMEVWDLAYDLTSNDIVEFGEPVVVDVVAVAADVTAETDTAVLLTGDTILGHALTEKRLRELHRKTFIVEADGPDGSAVEAKGWAGVAAVTDGGAIDVKGCRPTEGAGSIAARFLAALADPDASMAGKSIEAVAAAAALLAEVKAMDASTMSGLADDPSVKAVVESFFALGDALADLGVLPEAKDDNYDDDEDDDEDDEERASAPGMPDGVGVLMGGGMKSEPAPIVEVEIDDPATVEALTEWFRLQQQAASIH